ncbi:MAG: hopanoid biosynthesis-associated protein HpnK [Acidobacteria bacterium]|nr:hopanoid biosynthesis-associated protein HpnK [Acidobacteriota bacterium]
MNPYRVIINADDFGASAEVNEAIIRAHQDGVLTSCSLMVTGAAFEQAVQLAKENPKLGVGIHLVTVVGRSALPQAEIPTLVDAQGNFSNNPNTAGMKYFFSLRARRELRKELAAQFERFHQTGLPLSHIDGHLHLHIHPVIFKTALELGAKYGAKRMRVPMEELHLALQFDGRFKLRKGIHRLMFGALGLYMKRHLKKHDFVFAERVYGNLQSGAMNDKYFLHALEHLHAATNEIYFHPALYATGRVLNAEEKQLMIEFEALINQQVQERAQDARFQLINYFGLDTLV